MCPSPGDVSVFRGMLLAASLQAGAPFLRSWSLAPASRPRRVAMSQVLDQLIDRSIVIIDRSTRLSIHAPLCVIIETTTPRVSSVAVNCNRKQSTSERLGALAVSYAHDGGRGADWPSSGHAHPPWLATSTRLATLEGGAAALPWPASFNSFPPPGTMDRAHVSAYARALLVRGRSLAAFVVPTVRFGLCC